MNNIVTTLLDPKVLVTFIVCVVLAGLLIWVLQAGNSRRLRRALDDQRRQQESAVTRILDSVAKSKDEIIADYETQLRNRDAQVLALEKDNKRLKDRLAQGGLLGMFGGGQREVISSLLLENEQLHELLAQKQVQLRDTIQDMSNKLVSRLDEQVQENTSAIRYKQVLLSAFLQQEEARRLLDQFISEGRLPAIEKPKQVSVTQAETKLLPAEGDASNDDRGADSADQEAPAG